MKLSARLLDMIFRVVKFELMSLLLAVPRLRVVEGVEGDEVVDTIVEEETEIMDLPEEEVEEETEIMVGLPEVVGTRTVEEAMTIAVTIAVVGTMIAEEEEEEVIAITRTEAVARN
jgi:hypothetical protein